MTAVTLRRSRERGAGTAATGGTVTTGEHGAYTWAGYDFDEVESDTYEPGRVVLLAILVIAGAAVALASLPAAVGLGLQPAQLIELGAGFVSLAVVSGGVLGVLRWGTVALRMSRRLLTRRRVRLDATTAD